MAQTIYAGQLGVGLGLQGASDTYATSQGLKQQKQAHESDQAYAKAQLQRMEALGEAQDLELQIRQDERGRLKQEASVAGHLRRGMLNPESFDAEAYAAEAEGLPLSPADAMAQQFVETAQRSRQQQEFAGELQRDMMLRGAMAISGSGHMPGYAEGLADLNQRLAAWQADPMNEALEGPEELAAQYQAAQEQNFQFQAMVGEQEAASRAFDANPAWAKPELAAYKQMYMNPETRVKAVQLLHEATEPEAAAASQRQAREQVISEQQAAIEEQAFEYALQRGEPGTPEFNDALDTYFGARRESFNRASPGAGDQIVPKSETQLAQEAQVQQEDQWLGLLQTAGVPMAAAISAIEAGPEAVEAALVDAAKPKEKGKGKKKPKAKSKPKGGRKHPPAFDEDGGLKETEAQRRQRQNRESSNLGSPDLLKR